VKTFFGIGLFVFSDPGAAKAVLSQAMGLKEKLKSIFIISDRNYSFYEDFGLDVIVTNEPAEIMVDKINPDFIFTGTSYTSKIELEYLIIAKRKKIYSYAFIDHWTSIKERFLYSDYYIFPNRVLLIDERAKELALNIGIEATTVQVYGNPYYQYLKNWKPKNTIEELYNQLGFKNNNKLIVYAPEPLSNLGDKNIYGFDELEMTKEINEILNDSSLNINFVLKMHPNQKTEKLINFIGDRILVADSNINSNLLIYYSDLVLGFFSNFLIEAEIMNKKVYRIFKDKSNYDPLMEQNVGEKILLSQLKNLLTLI